MKHLAVTPPSVSVMHCAESPVESDPIRLGINSSSMAETNGNNVQVIDHREFKAIRVNRRSLIEEVLRDGKRIYNYYGLSKDFDVDKVA
jgi:hypothetical protein